MEVEEEEMEKSLGVSMEKDVVTCEVPFGGMLLLNNCIPHRSLENYSDKIRWSMDLRWQDPKKSVGFYGLKDCVTMRKAGDPNYKINWEGVFNSCSLPLPNYISMHALIFACCFVKCFNCLTIFSF